MKRTTVFLPDELKRALERTAAAQGQSEAQVIRAAIAAATAAHSYPTPRIPLFESGEPRLAEHAEALLEQGFGE